MLPSSFLRLWRHRSLLFQLTKRDVELRYRGSLLGLFWTVLTPLAMLAMYTFVFGVILHARWPNTGSDNLAQYAVILFWGITVFSLFSEPLSRSSRVVSANPNYVKRVIFPLELLPLSLICASVFQVAANFAILVPVTLITFGGLPWTALSLPLVMLPLLLIVLGCSWFVASLGVFIPDVEHSVAILTQVLFFMTPVLYSLESIPAQFRWIVALNPISGVIEDVRSVALWGQLPDGLAFGTHLGIGVLVALGGYAWFMKTKKAFADVL